MQNLIGKSVFNNHWRDNIISSSPNCIIDDEILNICGYVTNCKEIDSNVVLSIKTIAVGNINKNNLDIWKDYSLLCFVLLVFLIVVIMGFQTE